jgi:hypothetical protein
VRVLGAAAPSPVPSPGGRGKLYALVLTSMLAGLSACGEGPHLEGSVTPLLDLSYQRSEALADEEEASVRFITDQGSGENTVLKVTARLDNLQLTPNQPIDLTELLGRNPTPESPQRGTVSRSVLDEPSRSFPRIARGTLTFEKALTPGATVPGNFHVTFVTGTDVYSGRTVFGRFEATVP